MRDNSEFCRLTVEELKVCERRFRAQKVMGIRELELALAFAMLIDDRPWKIQKLGDHLGYARSAIRKKLHQAQSRGNTIETPEGWIVTEKGKDHIHRILFEIEQIALGNMKQFSEDFYRQELEAVPEWGVSYWRRVVEYRFALIFLAGVACCPTVLEYVARYGALLPFAL